jgi:hypothetical protein
MIIFLCVVSTLAAVLNTFVLCVLIVGSKRQAELEAELEARWMDQVEFQLNNDDRTLH